MPVLSRPSEGKVRTRSRRPRKPTDVMTGRVGPNFMRLSLRPVVHDECRRDLTIGSSMTTKDVAPHDSGPSTKTSGAARYDTGIHWCEQRLTNTRLFELSRAMIIRGGVLEHPSTHPIDNTGAAIEPPRALTGHPPWIRGRPC